MSLAQQSQTWFPTHVQVTVLQAKNLRSKGKAGSNDAYAIIQLGKEKYSTTVAEKSQAPVWKEEASFEVPLLHNNNQERCTVHIIVMHRALVGMDKFLGQLDLNLWELHQTKNRRKVQWYPLRSKPGKKEKERGQIEVEVEFKRNNMTASMFDLSMKEKSRSPFGKLKDKIKGKRSDGLPDTASAIVPSMNPYEDESDDEMPDPNKKKSKLKNLFSKPGLKKNSMSQSMSVLPTLPPSPSPSQRTVLKPGDFSSEFNQASGSPVSERRFPHFPTIMTHKRTASADTKQWSQATSGNKKEGLSFFTGLKSKNDPISRSNLCINGNHVYMEESEPKSDSPKDSLTNSPQIIRRNPMYASADNLFSSKETSGSSNVPDKGMTSSGSNSSLKSIEFAKSESSQAEDSKYKGSNVSSDLPKESKESKKPESKKSSLLSLVTGRKETPKNSVEHSNDVPVKREEPKTNGTRQTTDVQAKKSSYNPFEEDIEEEKKPEPTPPERNAKTSAVKPRLDVSSEAETKAKLSSSSVSGTSFLAASFYGGQGIPEADFHDPSNSTPSTYVSHSHDKGSSPPRSPTLSEGSNKSAAEPEIPVMSLFRKSGVNSNKQSEAKEVNVVAPFTEKNKPKKTYVKTLLDQLKGKSSHTDNENVVDADLVRGILPALSETSSFYEEPQASPEDNTMSRPSDFQKRTQEDEEFIQHLDGKDFTEVSTETRDKYNDYVKEVPKPTPRVQSAPKKESEDDKPVPPKPAPRSARINKAQDPVSDSTTTIPASQPKERADHVTENTSCVGASPVDCPVQSGQTLTNMKMAAHMMDDYSYRLDELPVIPENPEGTSDDEQLDVKDDKVESNLHSSIKTNGDLRVNKEDGPVQRDFSKKSAVDKDMADKPTSDASSPDSKVEIETNDSAHQILPETVSSQLNFPSSSPSISISSDKSSAPSVESPTVPTIDVSDKVEGSGKKKLLRAWVSPSETHPIPTVQSGGTVSSRQRTNPVKPLNTQNNNLSNFSQPIKNHENAYNSKKYDPSDPASAFAQLTHDELIQLVLKQRNIISKKDSQVRELEDYIDNLLVRVMEATPNILRSGSKKAGRI